MPTLYGPWEGSGTRGRIVVAYTRSYDSDHTDAIFDIDVKVEFDTSISDSVNSWSITSPDFPDDSGSNLSISFGSGGGTKTIKSNIVVQKKGDVTLTASVSNVEAVGTTVNHTFSLDAGDLAPYFTDTDYSATDITATSFTTLSISGNGNGSTLNNVQVEYNTSASSSGSTIKTEGNYSSVTVTGLTRATTYYFRIRVSNTAYGYGAWGPWKSFTTDSTIPGAPSNSFLIENISQTSAEINGGTVADNGGLSINNWRTEYNTSPSSTGSTVVTAGSGSFVPDISGLNPGTTYYVRIAAANANGWGPYTSWKSFTTLPGVSVNVGGVWKSAVPYVRVGGVWKQALRYVRVGGVWKQ